MTARLVALRVPRNELGSWLRAVWDAGDAALPLAWDSSARANRHADEVVARLRPAELVEHTSGGVHRRTLEDPLAVPHGTAMVVTTSGSTGAPRGVLLTHDALRASTDASIARLGARHGERFALVLPTNHIAGLQVLLRSWRCGTEPVVVDEPGSAPAADAEHISLVPTQLVRQLGSEPSVLARWRTVLLGGGPIDDDTLDAARDAGANIVCSYGMTETSGGCVYDGLPLDGVELRLSDTGRIHVRGPVLFSGYHTDPTPTLDDGWFATSDVGVWREGRLVVLGRADDVVVSGGENVPTQPLASTLRTHPLVADAAVIGWPDAEWGHLVVAVVVADQSDRTGGPTLAQLREHVKGSHPAAWAPRQLVVVDRLPRDAMGKLQRSSLRRMVAERLRG